MAEILVLAGQRDGFPGLGIASHTPFSIANLKYAETAKLDAFALAEGMLHLFEDGLDGMSGRDPRDIRGLCNAVNEVGFDHVSEVRRRSVAAGFAECQRSVRCHR